MFDLISKDPHISRTFILEISTPPCVTVNELTWWLQNLLKSVIKAVDENTSYILIACGLNPTQKYSLGLSFGEHHHIGCKEQFLRLAVYNMIRNFIPHFIALSVNSPFEANTTTDTHMRLNNKIVVAPRCIRSIRLYKNEDQLGPSSPFTYVPYLSVPDMEYFMTHVQRRKENGRLVDIYPFTIHDTVEMRFFDTQFSISRQVGIAILLDALAEKAKRIYYKEGIKGIPSVSAKSLIKNREEAIKLGLKGVFYADDTMFMQWPTFSEMYNKRLFSDGKENRYLNDAVIGMLYYIKDILLEKDLIDSEFLQPIFVSIFGGKDWPSMMSPADFLLFRYISLEKNIDMLLLEIRKIIATSAQNPIYDPLNVMPSLPDFLVPERLLSVDINAPEQVYMNQAIEYSIAIENRGNQRFRSIPVQVLVVTTNGDRKENITKCIPVINPKKQQIIHTGRLKMETNNDVIIKVFMKINNKLIKATRTVKVVTVQSRISTDIFGIDLDAPISYNIEIYSEEEINKDLEIDVALILPRYNMVLKKISKKVPFRGIKRIYFDDKDIGPIVIDKFPDDAHDVEVGYLRLQVKDESGNVVCSAKSGNLMIISHRIKVAFDRISEETPILRPVKEKFFLGDQLIIQFTAIPEPFKKDEIKILVNFVTKKSGTLNIFERSITAIKEKRFSFDWQIPFDMLITEEDKFRLEFIAMKGEKRVGYFETQWYLLLPAKPIAKILLVETPDIIYQGQKMACIVTIEVYDTEKLLKCIAKVITQNDEMIILQTELSGEKSVIIKPTPFFVTANMIIEDYLKLLIEIYDENNKLIDSKIVLTKAVRVSDYLIKIQSARDLAIPGYKTQFSFFVDGDFSKNKILNVSMFLNKLKIKKDWTILLEQDKYMYNLEIPLPLFSILEDEVFLEAEIIDTETNDILKKKTIRFPIDKSNNIQIDVDIRCVLENNEPVPDFLLVSEKVIVTPILRSKYPDKIVIDFQLDILENNIVVFSKLFENIALVKKQQTKLPQIEFIPTVDEEIHTIKITGKLFQDGFEIPVKIDPVIFFTIRE